tara:strand:+ start:1805 stop:2656 length:852 start_codon:yes stop_codon:yes gene_type:complete
MKVASKSRESMSVAYLRHSKSQGDQPSSATYQLKACCNEYKRLKKAGTPTPRWCGHYLDRHTSGDKKFKARPEGAAMMRDLEPGDHVFAYDIDRLGRNMMDIIDTAREMTDRGVIVHVTEFMGGTLDLTSDLGKLLLCLMAWMAERERAKIGARTKAALALRNMSGIKKKKRMQYPTLLGHAVRRKGAPSTNYYDTDKVQLAETLHRLVYKFNYSINYLEAMCGRLGIKTTAGYKLSREGIGDRVKMVDPLVKKSGYKHPPLWDLTDMKVYVHPNRKEASSHQ